jgi:hypothetical protein
MNGTAMSFDQARSAFKAAWRVLCGYPSLAATILLHRAGDQSSQEWAVFPNW